MPYFKKNEANILFIHIPKTGGTSLEVYFSSKYNIPLNEKSLYFYIRDEKLLNANINIKSSLTHMTYNEIIENHKILDIDLENIKIITIVRNPYERIMSDLFYYKLIKSESSKEEVCDIIKKYLVSDKYDNHNIPQYKYITNEKEEIIQNIHILRIESLINDMKKIGYEDFNVYENVNPNKVNYYSYLNNETIENINNFYNLDFILFDYKKITREL
jgi:hypothetical protein